MTGLVAQARAAAHRLLAQPLPQRHRHVEGVAARMRTLLELPSVAHLCGQDRDDVVAAAWLHDIGYSPALIDTGMHAIDGARYVLTVPSLAHLAPLIEHHSNARYEAAARGLRLATPTPEPWLRSLLWVADFTTSPNGAPTTWSDRLDDIRRRYPSGPVRAAVEECLPEFDLAHALVTGGRAVRPQE